MHNLNSLIIEGNLVRDPLLRSTPKGTPLCTFTLASNRFRKQESGYEQEVSFFDVESWSKLAQQCYDQGCKGRGVRVVGRLKQDRWTGSDGQIRSRISIVAEHVEFRPDFKKNEPNQDSFQDDTIRPANEDLSSMVAAAARRDDQNGFPVPEELATVMF
jgi:single-strand DNA-binding protein